MKKFLILLSVLLLPFQAQAALVATLGNTILPGTSILLEDGLENTEQQAFNEAQGVVLSRDIDVFGGTILAGTRVDSHIIFLNSVGNTLLQDIRDWTFDGLILGVMADRGGTQMAATDDLFANGIYFTDRTGNPLVSGSGFDAQGLEDIGTTSRYADNFTIAGMMLNVEMNVTEPGDWIRVITTSAVPVPAALFLFAPALLGFLGLRRKVSSTVA